MTVGVHGLTVKNSGIYALDLEYYAERLSLQICRLAVSYRIHSGTTESYDATIFGIRAGLSLDEGLE